MLKRRDVVRDFEHVIKRDTGDLLQLEQQEVDIGSLTGACHRVSMTLGWFETHGAERSRCESNCRDTESIFDLPYLFKSLEAADEIATGWLYDAQCQKEWYEPSEQEMALWRQGAVSAWKNAKGTYNPALAERALAEQGLDGFIATLRRTVSPRRSAAPPGSAAGARCSSTLSRTHPDVK